MKFKIHFTIVRAYEGYTFDDSIIIEAPTIEELQVKAEAEVAKRGGTDPWSEKIE